MGLEEAKTLLDEIDEADERFQRRDRSADPGLRAFCLRMDPSQNHTIRREAGT